MTDEELRFIILGCQRHDRESQRKLYYHFFKEMHIYVSSHINQKDKVEEIVNDGFLRVFRKINLYTFKGTLVGWIKCIMYHCVCDYIKANKKHDVLFFPEELHCSQSETQADNLSFKVLIAMIETLPEKTKLAFSLFIEGFTHLEISRMLSISESTSKWHISNAREILQKKILQNG